MQNIIINCYLILRTALAEAELEYDANFVSPSVYVRFALNKLTPNLQNFTSNNQQIYALVWTTTPWTLPSNQAICFNAELKYLVVKLQNRLNELYIICESLWQNFLEISKQSGEIVGQIKG